jgi:carotenoid cleavage dioxygenase-like enzyme
MGLSFNSLLINLISYKMLAIMTCMLALTYLFLILVTGTQAGPDDTISQLEVGYGNLDMNNVYHQEPVETVDGRVPNWLSGSLIRHGCGAYGRSTRPVINGTLDRVTHIFDCIEIGETFSFLNGQAFYTSKFYDTNKNDIYR